MSQIRSHLPRGAALDFFRRLHFYIGLFIGPFIFIAALTGTLYVLSTQIERSVYAHALTVDATGTARTLTEQIAAARSYAGEEKTISAVRPAPGKTDTTRVQFIDPTLGASTSRAIFIDPYSLAVRGDYAVYGSSGSMPLRMWIDQLHRGLLLGDAGRIYSELAASWMWVAALGGMVLWWLARPKRQRKKIRGGTAADRRLHVTLGLLLLAGLLLFSATGLTWSKWAGGNIDKLRTAFNWMTPQVQTSLAAHPDLSDAMDAHAHHTMEVDPATPAAQDDLWQRVLATARQAGLDAAKVEIRSPKKQGLAWTVAENQARWPTQVDAVAIDPRDMRIVDRTFFAQFPLAAKLTRWGIDFHMGLLFGLANQLLLIFFGVGVCVMILLGYRMWWRKRPAAPAKNTATTLFQAWLRLPPAWRIVCLLAALFFGLSLPVMGGSLLIFLLIDVARWRYKARQFTRAA